jgi:hypothetical protein
LKLIGTRIVIDVAALRPIGEEALEIDHGVLLTHVSLPMSPNPELAAFAGMPAVTACFLYDASHSSKPAAELPQFPAKAGLAATNVNATLQQYDLEQIHV